MGTVDTATLARTRLRYYVLGVVIALVTAGGFMAGLCHFIAGSGHNLFAATGGFMSSETLPLPAPVVIGVNQTFQSSLTSQSPRHLYQFRITRRGMVTINAVSSFDNYLELYTAVNGARIATDDDSGEGLNAQLSITLAPGDYQVLMRPYSSGTTGPYTITIFAPMETTTSL